MMMDEITWQPGITLKEIEKLVIKRAFHYFDKNKTQTAEALGIAIRTLDAKLAQYEEEEKPKDGIQEETGLSDSTGTAQTGAPNDDETKAGVHMESTEEVSEESSLPMQERQEVQAMPSRKVASNRKR